MHNQCLGVKRVAVRSPGHGCQLFPVQGDLSHLLHQVAQHFGQDADSVVLVTATSAAVVNDVDLIRDDETLVLNRKDFSSEWISLNVGGRRFTTTRSTLTSLAPDSMLALMFAAGPDSLPPGPTDASGAYLIDRSPEFFEPIISYLRHGQLIINPGLNPRGVLAEARFYGLQDVVQQLEQMMEEEKERERVQESSLSRREVIAALIRTTCASELRFQGVNLSGADLSRLDLRRINFKYAILRNCKMLSTNLSYACLERADLSHSVLDGAVLLACKMVCANLEFCSLRGVNCEAPYDDKTTMEGVNLKGADLDGSQLAGVVFRVATLKNAKMSNCDLRRAVLAGADLENCDLSGSDLQEANLRGANLKGAAFELMMTPLHMAQVGELP